MILIIIVYPYLGPDEPMTNSLISTIVAAVVPSSFMVLLLPCLVLATGAAVYYYCLKQRTIY